MAWALENWALVALLEGHDERSLRLMAAAAKLRETIEFPSWAETKVALQTAKEQIRSRLSKPDFAKAWATGDNLSFEQAAAYALEEAEHLPAL
jgi:hypothetical protein